MFETYRKYFPLILIICALGVRGFYYYQFQGNPFSGHVPDNWDQKVYVSGAQAFAEGDMLALDPKTRNFFSPLYQYFLGINYWLFGVNLHVIWIAQFLLGTASTLLVFAIGNYYFKPFVSFAGALLFTFYGPNLLYETTPYREVFIVFLELMSCFLLVRFSRSPNALMMILSAVFLSLLTQSRSSYFIIVPFALVFLWKTIFLKKDKGLRWLGAYLVIFFLASAPLLVWVHEVRGKWGLYDQTGMENLLLPNLLDHDPRVYGHNETYLELTKKLPQDQVWPALQYLIQTARERPVDFLRHYLLKLYYLFNNYEIPTTVNFYLSQEFSPILKLTIPFCLIGSLGILGMVLFRVEKKSWSILHAYFIANLIMCLMFWVSSRFRLSIIPFLSLFAAYTMWIIYCKIQDKKYFSLAIILISIVILNVVERTEPLPRGKIDPIDYINMGSTFLNNKILEDDDKGYYYFKKAWDLSRTLKPELWESELLFSVFSNYYIKQADKFKQQNDNVQELEALKEALLFDYSSAITHLKNGIAIFNYERKPKKAFWEFMQALVLDPDLQPPHEHLGYIYYDFFSRPLWALYHWQTAYNSMVGQKKETLYKKIKPLKENLIEQGLLKVTSNTTSDIQKILKMQIRPLVDFPLNLGLPIQVSRWTNTELEQYMISLYQRIILLPVKNDSKVYCYYQLGMIYWKKMKNEPAAFFYFQKAWEHGLRFKEFAQVLKTMYDKKTHRMIF